MNFDELNLAPAILKAVREQGYDTPTPIQAQAIPAVLAGQDLLAGAQTGTGKTAAFTLPMLHKLSMSRSATNRFGVFGVRALVLTPTRELAAQVEESVRTYGKYLQLQSAVIFGGVGMAAQIKALKKGVDILVATPGRLLDLQQQGFLDLSTVQMLVLDEADEMLRMGFIDDVETIIRKSPETRQVALFSATMPTAIKRIVQKYLKSPIEIQIEAKTRTADNIRQRCWQVSGLHKLDALTRILEVEPFDGMIIFARTKLATDELAQKLQARGFSAAAINGDINQAQRERTIGQLKDGSIDILVATDVAARGLDVDRISHVVNYDVPQHAEDYVHRIGRTGRAQTIGEAFTIMTAEELPHVLDIERFIGQKVQRLKIENFEYIYTALFNEENVAASLKSAKGVRTHKGMRYGARKKR